MQDTANGNPISHTSATSQPAHNQDNGGSTPAPSQPKLPWSAQTIDHMVKTIETTFPWELFATHHSIDVQSLRQTVAEVILFPLCMESSEQLQDFNNRVERYQKCQKALRKFWTRQERREARELRDYEKSKAKEAWQAKKKRYWEEMGALERDWRGSKEALAERVSEREAAWEVEVKRRRVEKEEAKRGWKVKEAGLMEVDGDDSDLEM
ncbi:MAG: hypothetical protein Q9222_004276 [Ikaeria aurantiellina]